MAGEMSYKCKSCNITLPTIALVEGHILNHHITGEILNRLWHLHIEISKEGEK